MDSATTVLKLADGIYALGQMERVRSFLLVGRTRALLVDSCFGDDLPDVCRSLTDKPITLVSTHADPDHIGGADAFEDHWMHPDELAHYRAVRPDAPAPTPAPEGTVFDAAPFRLEVIHLPGHTPGSIALLDREHRFLISGDMVATVPVYLFGPWRNVAQYAQSLRKLRSSSGAFDTIYPSHGSIPLAPSRIDETLHALELVLAGQGSEAPAEARFPTGVKTYSANGCSFFMDRT